jgi:hypothetical protein
VLQIRECVSAAYPKRTNEEKGRTAAQIAEAGDAGHRASLSLCSSQLIVFVVVPAASHPWIEEADGITKALLTDLVDRRRVEIDS